MELRHSTHGYPTFYLETGPRTILRHDASPRETREYYTERMQAEIKHALEHATAFMVSLDMELEIMKKGKTESETLEIINNAMKIYRQLVVEIEKIRQLSNERIKKIEALSDIEIMDKKCVRDAENESSVQTREASVRFNQLKKEILSVLQAKSEPQSPA